MKYEQIIFKFNQAIAWNSILFIVQKINKSIITFVLFYTLSTTDFATWANVFSLVFIATLFSDLGLRKTLPRYCPELAKNKFFKKKFLHYLLIFYISILVATNCLFCYFAPNIAVLLNLSNNTSFFYLGSILFCIESLKSVVRIIFYSYFKQKLFNFIETIFITLATFITIFIASGAATYNLVRYLFYIEITANLLIIIITSSYLRKILNAPEYDYEEELDTHVFTNDFIKHTSVMWLTTLINSITERNVLIPLLSYTAGHTVGNIFKVANDTALIFQRFIIRVLAIPGTALFSHIEAGIVPPDAKSGDSTQQSDKAAMEACKAKTDHMKKAFEAFNKKLIMLIAPMIGLLFYYFLIYTMQPSSQQLTYLFSSSMKDKIIPLFLLLSILYLSQLLFLSHEKMIEVKRLYQELLTSFTPYLAFIILIIIFIYKPHFYASLRLEKLIIFLHTIRFSSLIIRVKYVNKRFDIAFPKKFLLQAITICIIISTVGFLLQ